MSATRGFDPVRFDVTGTQTEPTILTRQDWRGPRAGWEPNDLGYWEISLPRAGRFDVTVHVKARRFKTKVHVTWGHTKSEQPLKPGETECSFHGLPLEGGSGRLEAWVEGNGTTAGVLDVVLGRISP